MKNKKLKSDEIERWKTIEASPFHQISSFGRFRSINRVQVNSAGQIRHLKGKILKTGTSNSGYESITINTPDRRHIGLFIAVLVAKAFVHNPKPKRYKFVNHEDLDKSNNYWKNLEWTTRSKNMKHYFRTSGVVLRNEWVWGEKHPKSKLSNEERDSIRTRYINGERTVDIAKDFNMTWEGIDYVAKQPIGREKEQL